MTLAQAARLRAFSTAAATEAAAIARGEVAQDDAVDRLVERFFPHLGNVDRDPQPARIGGAEA